MSVAVYATIVFQEQIWIKFHTDVKVTHISEQTEFQNALLIILLLINKPNMHVLRLNSLKLFRRTKERFQKCSHGSKLINCTII